MSDMQMDDMSMFTPIKKPAAIFAAAVAVWLIALLLLRPAWHISAQVPDQESARRVGQLLMTKYMIGFEASGMLILLGIFGAVYLGRPANHPDPSGRDSLQAAVDGPPVSAPTDELRPTYREQADEPAQGSPE